MIVFHPTINDNVLRKAFRQIFVSCYLNIVVIVRETLGQNHLLVYKKPDRVGPLIADPPPLKLHQKSK